VIPVGVAGTGQVGTINLLIWTQVDDDQTTTWEVISTGSTEWTAVDDAQETTWTRLAA